MAVKRKRAIVKKTKKYDRLEARIAREVKQRIEYAAELQGRSMTDFVIASADDKACQVIEKHQIVELSVSDSIAFAEAMLNPPEPTAKAVAAAKRYKERMEK